MRNIALCYGRLSKTTGANETTVDDQIRYCMERAAERGELCDPNRDVYREGEGRHSGRSLKQRPAMRRLLDRIKWDSSVASVIVYEQERSARDAEFAQTLARLCNQVGVDLVSVRDPALDIKSASGKMVYGIKASVAEYYANYVSEHVRDHHARAARNGWIHSTTASCGLELVGSKQTRHYIASTRGVYITEHGIVLGRSDAPPFKRKASAQFRAYLDTVRRACEMLAAGRSLRETALQLRSEQYYWTRHDGTPVLVSPYHLTAEKLLSILPRYSTFLDAGIVGDAIVNIRARTYRKLNGGHKLEDAAIPLCYKLIWCARCGKRLVFSYLPSHNQPRKFGYYHHQWANVCAEHRYLQFREVDTRIAGEVMDTLHNLDELWEKVLAAFAAAPAPDARLPKSERLRSIDRKIEDGKRLLFNKLLTEADYRQFAKEAEVEKAAIEKEPDTPEPPRQSPETARTKYQNLVNALEAMWRQRPRDANLALRTIIERIVVDGDTLTIEWKPDFAAYLKAASLD